MKTIHHTSDSECVAKKPRASAAGRPVTTANAMPAAVVGVADDSAMGAKNRVVEKTILHIVS